MSRPEPLQPVYQFSSAQEPVSLRQGTVEVDFNNDRFCGMADLVLRFLPGPRLVFHAIVRSTSEPELPFFLNVPDNLSVSFNGQKMEGFRGRWKANGNTLEFDWIPRSQPVVLSDMQPKNSVAAIFHLFNFPEFRGGNYQEVAPLGCALLVLESEDWKISLQELPEDATREAWDQIKNEGGCFLTHMVKMERKDGEQFSGEDAQEQCFLLDNFLSFINGGRCWPVCGVGLDASGETTWETFASPRPVRPPYSWFNPYKASQAELLFPLFAKRWQQSAEWRDCLHSAIYWYVQANTSGGSPSIDAAIILAQAALERLAHHYLVVDQKVVSGKGRASDRLRMLFSACGIPNEIMDATPDIRRANGTFKKDTRWMDAPHAITDIRNSLVHPVSKKKLHDCHVDAWKLSLWYLELSVLALCGYDGTYVSRLTAKYVTDSANVPWGKKA
ncbi:hypothetical protein [Comamonas sp. NLF-1-9]|uniref:hypothetical protein n=1 Tax=Comamonas sp. NLF-1-9 TaxID=2853163 RepID=UPI001C482108|nr:hypothetical protein [Comamonas sp. NLF-1-9]QXL85212.1 hypothetical protein KUD94_04350 [Comamonas sp. NLF-1-9]